jgi:hypothetical protein
MLLWLALALGAVGCGSIYKDTSKTLPPEPSAQLQFRLAEAQRAEASAAQAMLKLRERLNQGVSAEALAPDADRAETAARELQRQAAAARDAAAHCGAESQPERELERLTARAQELLDSVQVVRRAEMAKNARPASPPDGRSNFSSGQSR